MASFELSNYSCGLKCVCLACRLNGYRIQIKTCRAKLFTWLILLRVRLDVFFLQDEDIDESKMTLYSMCFEWKPVGVLHHFNSLWQIVSHAKCSNSIVHETCTMSISFKFKEPISANIGLSLLQKEQKKSKIFSKISKNRKSCVICRRRGLSNHKGVQNR